MTMSLGPLLDSTKILVAMALNGHPDVTAIVNTIEVEIVVKSQESRGGSRTIGERWIVRAVITLPRGVMGPAGVVSMPRGLVKTSAKKLKHWRVLEAWVRHETGEIKIR
jgi:hypothetical protein